MKDNQYKFYTFRKKCVNGVLINQKYKLTTTEFMEVINNIVVDLKEINENCWKIKLEDNNVDNSNIIYVEKA